MLVLHSPSTIRDSSVSEDHFKGSRLEAGVTNGDCKFGKAFPGGGRFNRSHHAQVDSTTPTARLAREARPTVAATGVYRDKANCRVKGEEARGRWQGIRSKYGGVVGEQAPSQFARRFGELDAHAFTRYGAANDPLKRPGLVPQHK
jgi:hypothetical protein